MARKLSPQMRTVLETLCGYENMIYCGTSAGVIEAAGVSRTTLYNAVKQGYANLYSHKSEDGSPMYYRTDAGTEALERDADK